MKTKTTVKAGLIDLHNISLQLLPSKLPGKQLLTDVGEGTSPLANS
jgi:hypothetical protein